MRFAGFGHEHGKVAAAAAALACALVLACTTCWPAFALEEEDLPAWAINDADIQEYRDNIDDAQKEVERTAGELDRATAAVEEARAAVEELQAQIDENQATIDRVSGQLATQKQRSADALRLQYLLDASGFNLTDFVFSSTTINEFLTNLEYMDHVQDLNIAEIKRYAQMKAEYEDARAALEDAQEKAAAEKQRADEEQANAEKALEEAQAARQAAQEAAEAEIARRQKELEELGTIDNNVNWSVSRDDFVEEWTGRINAYLAGSPMAGCGQAYAEAAWDFGVDPRWSPAISTIESGKGVAVPYNTSNNAWGWTSGPDGFRVFGSWEEGIRLHVEYLAQVYGYTVTLEHAMKYCPPNAEKWYKYVVQEMRSM